MRSQTQCRKEKILPTKFHVNYSSPWREFGR